MPKYLQSCIPRHRASEEMRPNGARYWQKLVRSCIIRRLSWYRFIIRSPSSNASTETGNSSRVQSALEAQIDTRRCLRRLAEELLVRYQYRVPMRFFAVVLVGTYAKSHAHHSGAMEDAKLVQQSVSGSVLQCESEEIHGMIGFARNEGNGVSSRLHTCKKGYIMPAAGMR